MLSHLFYYQIALLALLWLFVMLHSPGPGEARLRPPRQATTLKPKHTRFKAPKAFEGLTHRPPCPLCKRSPRASLTGASRRPPNRCPQRIAVPARWTHSQPCCPHTGCRYRGWRGLGHLRANGHPRGGPWRPCQCTACAGSFPEHHARSSHGTPASVERIVRGVACLAEG